MSKTINFKQLKAVLEHYEEGSCFNTYGCHATEKNSLDLIHIKQSVDMDSKQTRIGRVMSVFVMQTDCAISAYMADYLYVY